jgi:Arc/MetJ-type ribon-helix-helix transcriptional regulator
MAENFKPIRVNISEQMHREIEERIASGEYVNKAEFIRAAIKRMLVLA